MNFKSRTGRALAALLLVVVFVVGYGVLRAYTEGGGKDILSEPPLKGGGNETTGRLELDATKICPTFLLGDGSAANAGTAAAQATAYKAFSIDLNEVGDLVAIGNSSASAGTSNEVARADHRHAMTYGTSANTAAQGNVTATLANGNSSFTFGGNAAAIGANFTIDITPSFGLVGAVAKTSGTAAAAGTASDFARSDHRHQIDPAYLESGTFSIAAGNGSGTLTFSTVKSSGTYAVLLQDTVTTTSTFRPFVDTKTVTNCVVNVEVTGATQTFDYEVKVN